MSSNKPINNGSGVWDRVSAAVDQSLENPVLTSVTKSISGLLGALGVPEHLHPENEHVALCTTVSIATLVGYWFWLGKNHSERRRDLERDLKKAQQAVHDLEDRLMQLEEEHEQRDKEEEPNRPIRIWMDGAFDMMHYGHMNAFRQGAALGTYLVVGVNSDETITACKGKPVNSDEERIAMVRSVRWVDEVVPGVPYIMNDEYLKYVIEKYRIDYVVHGDDPCIVDGKDVYESAQKMGKYLTIPRTEGISTTDIVGRMLLMTKSHHNTEASENPGAGSDSEESVAADSMAHKLMSKRAKNKTTLLNRKSNFLTTSRIIRLFSANFKPPKPEDTIVYLAGSWDMFHAGHVALLEEARKFGTYVIVGVHNDAVVNAQRGRNLPILNLNERVLSVLGCKYVDDVLFDAPFVITSDLLSSLNIKVVVTGTVNPEEEESTIDAYATPRQLGILKQVPSKVTLSVMDIVDRIQQQRERYTAKYAKKKVAEDEYYINKYSSGYGAEVAKEHQDTQKQ